MSVSSDPINEFGAWMLGLAVIAPGLLAVLWPARACRPTVVRLTPWAALPALLVTFLTPTGTRLELEWLILGTRLGLDNTGRAFLFLTALLWGLAGVFSRSYLKPGPERDRFCGFYLLAMAGNVGLVLALDVPGFYLFFTLMSFASYGLVVHRGDAKALRDGRVYILLVLLGEVLLFAAFVLMVSGTGSTRLPVEPASQVPRIAFGLALLGFGLKAGLVPLHIWLPLAHPVAPTPASAVLSGAMIKAGVIGWLRFLPLGQTLDVAWGSLLIALGFAGAFFGVVVGLMQRDLKTLLAYSSVSQMGIITAGIGAGLLAPEHWEAVHTAILLYVLHHGLAKGALFLGVGVAEAAGRHWRRLVTAALSIPALTLAGAPLTSGALVKLSLYSGMDALPVHGVGWLTVLLPWTAAGTALLMTRFLVLLWTHPPAQDRLVLGLWVPWSLLLAASLGMSFFWPIAPDLRQAFVAPANLWGSTWPVLLAVCLSLLVWRWGRRLGTRISIPAGDFVVWIELACGVIGKRVPDRESVSRKFASALSACETPVRIIHHKGLSAARRGELELQRGSTAGLMFLLIVVVLVLLLAG
jgi:formate hydrogenlyase subunit 3/multisubunit Na+/H+ antiporter MnhD subunit